jgi:DNA-binding MarR family transcriptional regulator
VNRTVTAASTRELSDVVTRLRRALRRSIRTDYPWEARPMAQVEVLQSVAESGPTRVSELADRLRLAQSTVSTLVGTLAAAGLLTRDVHPDDRRASVVALTPAGAEDMRHWDAAHRRRLSAALRTLAAGDREMILDALPALGRLVDALNA